MWYLEDRFDVFINKFTMFIKVLKRHNFCRYDGRQVKIFLFSTLLDKFPLTSIYFASFEKGSQVSPTHTTKLFGFLANFTFFDYMSTYVLELSCILARRILRALVK